MPETQQQHINRLQEDARRLRSLILEKENQLQSITHDIDEARGMLDRSSRLGRHSIHNLDGLLQRVQNLEQAHDKMSDAIDDAQKLLANISEQLEHIGG